MTNYYFRDACYKIDSKVWVISSLHSKFDGYVVAIGIENIEFKIIYTPTSISRTYWEF